MLEVKVYKTNAGVEPLSEWLSQIKDVKTKSILMRNLTKLQTGLLGNTEAVGDGVSELKVHYGGGYRIYYGHDGNELIVVLCGGAKGSQKKDISKAKEYWREYLQTQNEGKVQHEKHKRPIGQRTQKE